MPNPSPLDDLKLFRHISSGQLRWYPKSYMQVPEFAADLTEAGGASGVAEVRRNMVDNPTPAVNATNGWIVSSINVTRSAEWSANPSGFSFKAVTTGGTNGDFRLVGSSASTIPAGMQPGKTYTMQATINRPAVDAVSQNRSRRILLFVSTNGTSYTEMFGPQLPNITGVQLLTYTFTLPANTTGAVLGIGAASNTSGVVTYIDNVMLEEADTVRPYFDGGFPQNGNLTYDFVATPYNSPSRELTPVYGSLPDIPKEPKPVDMRGPLIAPPVPPEPVPNVILSVGFEDGTFGPLSPSAAAAANWAIYDTDAQSGTYAAGYNSTGDATFRVLQGSVIYAPTPTAPIMVTGWVRFPVTSTTPQLGGIVVGGGVNDDTTAGMRVLVDYRQGSTLATNALQIRRNTGTVAGSTASRTIAQGEWLRLDILWESTGDLSVTLSAGGGEVLAMLTWTEASNIDGALGFIGYRSVRFDNLTATQGFL